MRNETLKYMGKEYPFEPGDSVLDCLKASGLAVPSSCYSGSCGACLLRAARGTVSTQAQSTLHSGARAVGEFFSCVCPARADLEIEAVDGAKSTRGRIEWLGREDDEVFRLHLALERTLDYRAGQVVHLVRPSDGLSSLFSITSVPGESLLELYWMERDGGAALPWFAQANSGEVVVRGPSGHFFYMNDPAEPLVVIGSGIAAAPVLGVLRHAIRERHQAPIVFIRLVARPAAHFRRRLEELEKLADCDVIASEVVVDTDASRTVKRVLSSVPGCLSDARVYLAGESLLLRKLRLQVFGRGADQDRIHRFVLKPLAGKVCAR